MKIARNAAAMALAAGLLMGFATPAAAQQTYDMAQSHELTVAAGKSQVLELPEPYADLMIADPKIADVLPLSRTSVYVVGKAQGSTALTIYGPGRKLIAAANVVVTADLNGFKSRLASVLPDEKNVEAQQANQSLILSGTVSSPAALQQVLALAETYAPKGVVNMMGVEGTQQVMLSVRFVEMSRTVAKNFRANVNRLPSGDNPSISVFTGDTNIGGLLDNSFGLISAVYNNNLEILIEALEEKGMVKTLAEPTLVAMSGDTASFLAGGEFPIPVAQDSDDNGASITIEFKQFGVALGFTPTILKDGLINIAVAPEVSSIDPSATVDLGIIEVPGLKVRRTNTTVELRDGESFTIAGMLKDDYESQVRQLPFAGEIPIIGSLFRSSGYMRNQTELVIVVTPHIVTPRRGRIEEPGGRWTPPSDVELFFLGAQRSTGAPLSAEDRALISGDRSKAGVDGSHGHVLH